MIDVRWLWALLVLDGLIVVVAATDAWLGLPTAAGFSLRAEVARIWSLGRSETLRFIIETEDARGWLLTAKPDLPGILRLAERPSAVRLPGRTPMELVFRVTAHERGTFRLAGLHVAVVSRLGLWQRNLRLGKESEVHVYPNLKQLGEYALLARTNRLSLIGVRRSRRIGGDTEFERLRDWHSDDAINRVDWKATARRDRLTVRDYQVNHSQSVVLMLDAGRMMAGRTRRSDGAEVTLLDLGIDAAVMLAFVALNQNDRVGLLCYADRVLRWVPPRGGTRQLGRLIHALHDLQPRLVESRHEQAFAHLERHERKRSLVVLFSHVLDDVNADLLVRHCANLVGRHLPLTVLLRDPDLHDPLASAPADLPAFWRAGAAALLVNWRSEVLKKLEKAGALTLDVEGEQLTPDVINQYLQVKAKHLL